MSAQQAKLAMTGEQRIDEHGEADQWDRGGIYDASGQFDLEATKSELADRFQDVKSQLPDQVGEYTKEDTCAEYIAAYRSSGETQSKNGFPVKSRRVRIFARGPHLNEWTVEIREKFEGGGSRSWLHSDAAGLNNPRAAVATAFAIMRSEVPLKP